jgi:hypothetical protein
MQAIARVNRLFRNKPGGLVVDYLGLTLHFLVIFTSRDSQKAEAGKYRPSRTCTCPPDYRSVQVICHLRKPEAPAVPR